MKNMASKMNASPPKNKGALKQDLMTASFGCWLNNFNLPASIYLFI